MNTDKPSSINYFHKIDFIRFIAAFMVVIYHAFGRIENIAGGGLPNFLHPKIKTLITQSIHNGGFGVDIFFIISGFLITYLLITEKESTGKINLLNFYIRRSLRIWPLYFLIVFTAPFLAKLFNVNPAPIHINLLFINNFWVINTHWWVFPTAQLWSLCIEEQFYLIWPFIIAFVPNKYLPNVFVASIIIALLYRGYVGFYDNNNWFKLYLHTLSRIDALSIGALVAYFYQKNKFTLKTSKTIVLIVFLFFIFLTSIFSIITWETPFVSMFKNTIFLSLASFLIFQLLFNENINLAIFNSKIISYLGKISYGIYMFGFISLTIVSDKILPYFNQQLNISLFWILTLILTIGIPILSFELFEKHFLKLKDKFQVITQKQ